MYRVEILREGEVVRAIETNATNALYAAADEIADFGAPQSSLAVRVAQLSPVVGPGRFRSAALHL
jgi:hypothetical protein